MALPTSSEILVISNYATRLIFKKLYLSVYYFDLGDLWLVGKILERSTSFMLNTEADLAIFEGEFIVEQKLGVWVKLI